MPYTISAIKSNISRIPNPTNAVLLERFLTGLTPGQQVDVPVKFRTNISSDNNTSYFSGYRYDKGGIDYTGSIATKLFID